MNTKEIAFIVFGILIVLALVAVFISPVEINTSQKQLKINFQVISMGRVGDYGYANVNYSGNQFVRFLAYSEKPSQNIFIVKDQGIGNQKIGLFINATMQLEKYGYKINTVSPFSTIISGTYLLPTGAMPISFLENVKNQDNITVIYYGKKDLIIDDGIKKFDWYSTLDDKNKSKFVVKEVMPDDLNLDSSFIDYIAESNWTLKYEESFYLSGIGLKTIIINNTNASFIRVIRTNNNSYDITDYSDRNTSQISLGLIQIFPGETATIYFSLPKTNGSASFVIEKDDLIIQNEELKRVSEEESFRKDILFSKSGTYMLKIVDNSGVIGGGILHVKEVIITPLSASGRFYTFNATIDGVPIKSEKVLVSLNDGLEKQSYVINNGVITIQAQLKKGKNLFNFFLSNHYYSVEVENNYESIIDVYIKYGFPGAILIIIIFLFARFSRKPSYTIRIGNTPNEIRKEIKITVESAVAAFKNTPIFLGVSEPITSKEFSFSLKKFATEGAEVTEGNVEELLQQLNKMGIIENHKNYYQLKSKQNAKRNYLLRAIKEKLISQGISFIVMGDKIKTNNFEIGFPNTKFSGKGVVVFEDDGELKIFYSSLNNSQLAQLRLKQGNNLISIVTLDSLDELL
ncbi:MAG: hypothetical protein Q7S22_00500 [Candidatus Micrarchaeota archaeon]|nr:hypothetical protein [Candidatus Micrarchaeota archaeon]